MKTSTLVATVVITYTWKHAPLSRTILARAHNHCKYVCHANTIAVMHRSWKSRHVARTHGTAIGTPLALPPIHPCTVSSHAQARPSWSRQRATHARTFTQNPNGTTRPARLLHPWGPCHLPSEADISAPRPPSRHSAHATALPAPVTLPLAKLEPSSCFSSSPAMCAAASCLVHASARSPAGALPQEAPLGCRRVSPPRHEDGPYKPTQRTS